MNKHNKKEGSHQSPDNRIDDNRIDDIRPDDGREVAGIGTDDSPGVHPRATGSDEMAGGGPVTEHFDEVGLDPEEVEQKVRHLKSTDQPENRDV
jgi:hypothetical protein